MNFSKYEGLHTNQILHIVKMASLFFPVIAYIQYYIKSNDFFYFLMHDGIRLVLILTVILAIYLFLNFIKIKMHNNKFINTWVDPFAFLSISFIAVMATGSYQSNYKFLFLFVIILSSIECSMKANMIIATISASIILAVDIVFAPRRVINVYFEGDLVLACAFLIISWTIGYYVSMEKQHIANLNEIANIDGLTELYNHRYFYNNLTKKMKENKTNLALLFIDIDYFKSYNDLFGHQKGDEALKIIALKLRECTRKKDIISRYGGEEFAIILPETTEKEALKIAEKLRFSVEEEHFSGQECMPNKNITISVGVSVYPTKAKSEIEIVKYADDALYRAKFLRKNRVEAYVSILDELQNEINETEKEIIASIKTLIAIINSKDKYTFKHVERVVSYCLLVAEKLGFDDATKKNFIYAAYMHDIGKINIPEEILIKSTPLTDEEWEILKEHPKNAVDIIKSVLSFKKVIPIILQHHERYDGKGYPAHLKENEISFLARMLTIIDSFDAMTFNRPYQKKKTFPEAFNELEKCSGTQFDPEMVQIFIKIIKENLT